MSAVVKVFGFWLLVIGKKQNTQTRNPLRRSFSEASGKRKTRYYQGFSLIEVLISISIIALVGSVAIPNFRNFSSSQEIGGTAQEIINTFKIAQSSAQSRIQCPAGESSDSWIVRLTNKGYSLVSKCQTAGEGVLYFKPYSPAGKPEKAYTGELDVCGGLTTDIIFTKTQVFYKCLSESSSIQAVPVKFTLKDPDNPLNIVIINIESGGVIKIDK